MARVLQLVTDSRRRGAQVFAGDLAEELTREGHRVSTVALWRVDGDGELPFPTLGRARGWSTASFLRPLARLATDCDVLVAHGGGTAMAAAILSATYRSPQPVIYRQISDLDFWAGQGFRLRRTRWYLRHVAFAVALWEGAARRLIDRYGLEAARVRVIPNGVPEDRFGLVTPAARATARSRLNLASSERVVAYVGALVEEKGVDLLIRAMSHTTGRVLIAGQGPERESLERLALQVCGGRAHFLGSVGDVREVYGAADVVVLPSRGGDSMPATLIEAGMSGVPTVASRIDAIPEVVLDGRTGVLCETSPMDIAHAIEEAFERRVELSSASRDHCVTNFGMRSVGSAWSHLIEEVVGSGNR